VWGDLVLLSDAVGPSLGLKVVLWVPVTVEDDDRVRSRQVQAESTGPRRQKEAEVLTEE